MTVIPAWLIRSRSHACRFEIVSDHSTTNLKGEEKLETEESQREDREGGTDHVSLSLVQESSRERRVGKNEVDDESESGGDSSDQEEDVDPGVDRDTELDDTVRHTQEDDLEEENLSVSYLR